MTAPRVPLFQRKPNPTHPEPMDIPGTQQEMDAWLHRGGQIDPSSEYAKYGTKYPGGTYGGEFSDEDVAAFHDAMNKIGLAKMMEHLRPLIDAHNQMPARPDATAAAPAQGAQAPDLTARIAQLLGPQGR